MFAIKEARQGDIAILGLSGRLDANTSPELLESVDTLVESGVFRVVADCSRLDYVSSSGLRVFLLSARKLKAKEGGLVVCSLSSHVRKVFDVSGFSSILPIASSSQEAVTSYGT